jgi:enoyl-CoA hydratase
MATEQPEAELRSISDEASYRVFASTDAQEGPRAFLEKRPPVWQGR